MNRFILYTCLLVAAACGSNSKTPEAAPEAEGGNTVSFTPAQMQQAGLQTGKPQQEQVQATIRVNGVVEAPPQNKVTVSFPLGGYVVKTGLLPGMHIRKGQVLATLQDPVFIQLQQDYLTARSKLVYLEREYNRQRALNATKTTSDKLFEQTAAEYRAERINAQALREKLLLIGINPARLSEQSISRTVFLHAPISGYVSAVNVNRGKYVSPTDVLFELVDPAGLHLSLTVFERDLMQIKPGQKVTAWLTTDTARTYTATVHFVGRTLDESRSAAVHCDFSGAAGGLVPGMFMNAAIALSEQRATVVPEDAVVRFGANEYIFVAKGETTFEMVPVTTGVRNGGKVALTAQNPALLGQPIILKNAYAALMKLHNRSEEE